MPAPRATRWTQAVDVTDQLTPGDRTLLVLRPVFSSPDKVDHWEMASLLGQKQTSSATNYNRAKKELWALIDEDAPDPLKNISQLSGGSSRLLANSEPNVILRKTDWDRMARVMGQKRTSVVSNYGRARKNLLALIDKAVQNQSAGTKHDLSESTPDEGHDSKRRKTTPASPLEDVGKDSKGSESEHPDSETETEDDDWETVSESDESDSNTASVKDEAEDSETSD